MYLLNDNEIKILAIRGEKLITNNQYIPPDVRNHKSYQPTDTPKRAAEFLLKYNFHHFIIGDVIRLTAAIEKNIKEYEWYKGKL